MDLQVAVDGPGFSEQVLFLVLLSLQMNRKFEIVESLLLTSLGQFGGQFAADLPLV
jgi:hypothetical protein